MSVHQWKFPKKAVDLPKWRGCVKKPFTLSEVIHEAAALTERYEGFWRYEHCEKCKAYHLKRLKRL